MQLDIGINQEEYRLWVLLHRTSYAMRRARELELKETGVSSIQATVLILIKSSEKPLTVGDITKSLFREPHTVSGLLSRMEKQGLIKRVPAVSGRKRMVIEITKIGEEIFHKTRKMKIVHKIMSGLSKKEQTILKTYLETLRRKSFSESQLPHEEIFP